MMSNGIGFLILLMLVTSVAAIWTFIYLKIKYRHGFDKPILLQIAEKFGFRIEEKGMFGPRSIVGKIGNHNIYIRQMGLNRTRKIKIELSHVLGSKYCMCFTRKDPTDRIDESTRFLKVITGNESFDSRIVMDEIYEKSAVALFNEKMRLKLLSIFEKTLWFEVDQRKIFAELKVGNSPEDVIAVTRVIEDMEFLGRLLRSPGSVKKRLIYNYRHEREASVRIRSLVLLWSFPRTDETVVRTCRDAIDDPDVGIAVFSFLAHKDAEPDVLYRFLENPHDYYRMKVIKAIRSTKKQIDPMFFINYYKNMGDAFKYTRIELLEFFALQTDEKVQKFLIGELDTDDIDIKLSLIRILGARGDVKVVEPLYKLSSGVFANLSVKQEARQAIVMIQERLGVSEKGGLSLANDKESGGEVSISDDEGKLSVDDPGDSQSKIRRRR